MSSEVREWLEVVGTVMLVGLVIAAIIAINVGAWIAFPWFGGFITFITGSTLIGTIIYFVDEF